MTPSVSRVQLLTGAAAAAAWRFAIAEFLCLSLLHLHFPLPAGVLAMAIAFLTTSVTRGRGWRVIQAGGLQFIGWALTVLTAIYLALPWSDSFWSTDWITALISEPRDLLGWFTVCLYAGLTLLFWWGGWFLVRGKSKFYAYYARFDIGMSLFVVLFTAKFLLEQRGGIVIDDPAAIPAFVSFLIFGLLSIGTTRRKGQDGQAQREYLPGYKTLGMLAAFTGLVVLVGIGLAALFMPYLAQAADVGYQVLIGVSRPMGNMLTSFLRMLLTFRRDVEDSSAVGDSRRSDGIAEGALQEGGGVPEWIVYVILAFCGLVVLIGLAYLTWLLIQWLLSRTPQHDEVLTGPPWAQWLRRLQRAGRLLLAWLKAAFTFNGRRNRPSGYWYGLLIKWGRRSGIVHAATETPREYVQRLKARFPMLGGEMDVIVALFNLETYGGLAIQPAGRLRAAAAWRIIRSPRFWGRRLLNWVRRS